MVKIVEYNNAFDGRVAYGLIYEREDLDRYAASDFVKHPKTIWEAIHG